MSSARVGSFDELISFLGAEGASFRQDPTSQIVQLALRPSDGGGPLFIRWERNLPYVQIVTTLARDIADERIREVLDALARLNHAIPLPGFGIDLARRQVYFRSTLLIADEGVPVDLLKRAVLAVASNARNLSTPLRRVIAGEPGARVLQLVAEEERARSAAEAEGAGALFTE